MTVTLDEEVPTLVTLSWVTEDAVVSFVEFGEGQFERTSATEAEATTEHSRTLVGLAADTQYSFRVSDSTVTDAFTTGSLPPALPSFVVTGDAGAGTGWMATTLVGALRVPVLIDRQGRITWWHLGDGDQLGPRAIVSAGGTGMVTNRALGVYSREKAGEAAIIRIPWAGPGVEETSIPAHTHDFVEHQDGTLAALRYVVDVVDGESVVGNQLVEVAPDGSERVVWSAFDEFDPRALPQQAADSGWTHANALDYLPEDDTYLVSLHSFRTIGKIRRSTGELLWAFGGRVNTFTFGHPAEQMRRSHQFQWLDGGLLAFDNGDVDRRHSCVSEFRIDEAAQTAERVWSYQQEPTQYLPALGDVHRLADGSTLVVWSMLGQIERVDPAGNVLWSMSAPLGSGLGYVSLVESLDR